MTRDVTLPLVFHGGSIHGCSRISTRDISALLSVLFRSSSRRRGWNCFYSCQFLFTPEDALSLMLASKVFVIVYEMLEILLYVRLSWMFNLKAGLCLEFIWIALGLPLGIFSKRFCWWIFFNLTDWMDDWVRWSRNIMNE